MDELKRFWFKSWSPLATIRESVEAWSPPNFHTEKDFEESLSSHLKEQFTYLDIRRQFPYGRIRADIVVEQMVAIEIKHNLVDTKEFQRLIGQLDTYAEWGIHILVLIIGEVKLDFKRRIEKRLLADWYDLNDHASFIQLQKSENFT